MLSWLFQHDYLDTYCFECLIKKIMHVFCIFVFAPVQRSRACFTWKGALEICSLLLLLLLSLLLLRDICSRCVLQEMCELQREVFQLLQQLKQ